MRSAQLVAARWILAEEAVEQSSKGTLHVRFGREQVRITLRRKAADRQVSTLSNTANEVISSLSAFMQGFAGNLGTLHVKTTGAVPPTLETSRLVCGRFGVLVQADGEIKIDLGSLSSRDPQLLAAARAAARPLGLTVK